MSDYDRIDINQTVIAKENGQRFEIWDLETKMITVKFLNFRTPGKLCCNLPKIQTKRQNLRVFCPKDANGKANSEDPDQTATLGVKTLIRLLL